VWWVGKPRTLTIGEAPANAPLATRNQRKAERLPPCSIQRDCATKPHPTPNREAASTGFRPTLSDKRGHRKSAKNIPSGYALVK
jgi:hypothetical protein